MIRVFPLSIKNLLRDVHHEKNVLILLILSLTSLSSVAIPRRAPSGEERSSFDRAVEEMPEGPAKMALSHHREVILSSEVWERYPFSLTAFMETIKKIPQPEKIDPLLQQILLCFKVFNHVPKVLETVKDWDLQKLEKTLKEFQQIEEAQHLLTSPFTSFTQDYLKTLYEVSLDRFRNISAWWKQFNEPHQFRGDPIDIALIFHCLPREIEWQYGMEERLKGRFPFNPLDPSSPTIRTSLNEELRFLTSVFLQDGSFEPCLADWETLLDGSDFQESSEVKKRTIFNEFLSLLPERRQFLAQALRACPVELISPRDRPGQFSALSRLIYQAKNWPTHILPFLITAYWGLGKGLIQLPAPTQALIKQSLEDKENIPPSDINPIERASKLIMFNRPREMYFGGTYGLTILGLLEESEGAKIVQHLLSTQATTKILEQRLKQPST